MRKEKKSIANTGEKNGFYGKHHTEETKELIRQRLKEANWHPNEEQRQKNK